LIFFKIAAPPLFDGTPLNGVDEQLIMTSSACLQPTGLPNSHSSIFFSFPEHHTSPVSIVYSFPL
jgi:hypothetical protein